VTLPESRTGPESLKVVQLWVRGVHESVASYG